MYQFLRRIKTKVAHIVIYVLLGGMCVSCTVVPQPSVDIYIEPIEGQTNTRIHPETGAVTVVQKGVAVTIEALDEAEIFALTENPHSNPYQYVSNNGNVEPIYTVFELTIHNLKTSRVLVEESAMLIDKNGAQYANLPFDYFEDLYGNLEKPEQNAVQTPPYPQYHIPNHRYYPYYQNYVDIAALQEGREVLAQSLFESGKLFKGAKRRGLIVFDRLHRDTTEMRIIIPEVVLVNSDGKQEKLKFNFDFRQVIAEKSVIEKGEY